MKWYEGTVYSDGVQVDIEGNFFPEEQLVTIIYGIHNDEKDEIAYYSYWRKNFNMWAHQDVLAEDILAKYMGKIKKLEKNLPMLIERAKLNERI